MGKNLVTKVFLVDDTWVAPASVRRAKISLYELQNSLSTNTGSGGVDLAGPAYAWGVNANGQLGVGDVLPRSSPVAVLGGFSFTQLRRGLSASFGISAVGDIYGWGNNVNGLVGDGSVVPKSSPVAVIGGFKFKTFATSGDQDSCVLGLTRDGALYAWGYNLFGQCGVGDVTPRSSPVLVVGNRTWRNCAQSLYNSLGLEGTTLYSWGRNTNGELGAGNVLNRSSPVAVLGGHSFSGCSIGSVSGGGACYAFTALGAEAAGIGYAWGFNANGQLGVGDVTPRSSPVAVLGGLTFKQIVGGAGFALGLTSSGLAYAWGVNDSGQLGLGDVVPRSSPVAVLGSITFAKLGTCGNNSFGLSTDGALYAWGENINGQLGVGDVTPRSSPVAVLGNFRIQTPIDALVNQIELTVVPGTSYNISIQKFFASFGTNQAALSQAGVLGNANLRYIELEYFI